MATDTTIPEKWIKTLSKQGNAESQSNIDIGKTLFTMILMSEFADKKTIETSQRVITPYLLSSIFTISVKNIIENIDTDTKYTDKDVNVYENGFDLTEDKGYTMPPTILMDDLDSSSKNQNIAETILLAGKIASQTEGEKLYLGTLGKIITALNKIGYKQTAQNMLAQAILEHNN